MTCNAKQNALTELQAEIKNILTEENDFRRSLLTFLWDSFDFGEDGGEESDVSFVQVRPSVRASEDVFGLPGKVLQQNQTSTKQLCRCQNRHLPIFCGYESPGPCSSSYTTPSGRSGGGTNPAMAPSIQFGYRIWPPLQRKKNMRYLEIY